MPETESDPTPLSRIELLRLAQSLGVSDADVMTRAELRTAIEQAKAPAPPPIEQPTTWVSVARRLLASVVERGLNLPDAAALIRGDAKLTTPPKAPPPVATLTLARIYAAQGHLDRAIGTLDEVLESDPDHELARDLRAQLELRRQESLARDADAAPSHRPEDELTPIMPEVALREAAERGEVLTGPELALSAAAAPELTPPAAAVSEEAPVSEAAASEAAASEPVASEPVASEPVASEVEPSVVSEPVQSDAPGELVAPAFAVAERAEPLANGSHDGAHALVEGVTNASETPPAPSVFSHAEAESEAPTTLAAVDLTPPASDEAAPYSYTANGIENGVAHAPSPSLDPNLASAERSIGAEPVPAAPLAAEPLPAEPGLVLIESDRHQYLYWELGSSRAPCWLHLVSHAPALDGNSARRERRFPVQQRCGALRIEGVPADAVVRAKLSRDPDGKAVAVAGAVRSHETSLEIQFCPRPHAPLEDIARRAQAVLARATPVYWDS